jgi:hypothetical protein
MDKIVGKQFWISGMTIEVISKNDDQYETRNITTGETIFFDKSVLENAIKLGKAEEVTDI